VLVSVTVLVVAGYVLGLADLIEPSINDMLSVGHTEYAAGYSEWNFLKVRPGMSEDQVRQLLGPPFVEFEIPEQPGIKGWRYSRSSPVDRSYNVRVIHFREHVVTKVLRKHYVD
jgi:hypothetical protein